jgi:hypothetical protein
LSRLATLNSIYGIIIYPSCRYTITPPYAVRHLHDRYSIELPLRKQMREYLDTYRLVCDREIIWTPGVRFMRSM